MTIVELTAGECPLDTGGKFANLTRAAAVAAVPWACCIPGRWFERCVGDERLARLERLFLELRATVAYDLPRIGAQVEAALDGLAVDPELRRLLSAMVHERGSRGRYIVRPSPIGDDAIRAAEAGAYRAFSCDGDLASIERSILSCWRGYYSPEAVALRLTGSDFSATPRLAVFIQAAVTGAAHGTTLVSGATIETRSAGRSTPEVVRAVEDLAAKVADERRASVEVEWVWSDRAHVIQARSAEACDALPEPRFDAAALYADELLGLDRLGSCEAVYRHYVTKRRWAYRAAAAAGVATGSGSVFSFNGPGLTQDAHRLNARLAKTPHPRVVLDLAPTIRQIVLPKAQAVDFLCSVFASPSRAHHRDGVIVRDFVAGLGAVSQSVGDDDVLVEHADGDLMQLNRGLAPAARVVIGRDGAHPDPPRALGGALPGIYRFTRDLDAQSPGIKVEWALVDGRPHFVDYTARAKRAETDVAGRVVSRGSARGPAVVLDDDLLSELSIGSAIDVGDLDAGVAGGLVAELIERVRAAPEPPIVVARRPYAILACVIEFAAGFIFAGGSVLCHLAITLRENGCPAVLSAAALQDGDEVAFADGRVVVLSAAPSASPPED